jgi:hypothetical protein
MAVFRPRKRSQGCCECASNSSYPCCMWIILLRGEDCVERTRWVSGIRSTDFAFMCGMSSVVVVDLLIDEMLETNEIGDQKIELHDTFVAV